MKVRLLIFVLVCCLSMLSSVVAADSDRTPTQLQKKLDSLFVIASSGELKYRDKVEPAIESIAKLGVLVVPPLIDKFTTNSARERLTIINIFKKIGSPAVPDLVDALSRPNWLVVKRVCWALGDIGDSAAVMPLLNSAGHENWQVREYCLGALGKIGDLRAVDAVINSFSDSVGQVRKAAVFSAGKLKSAETISQLIQALDDPYYGARLSAVEALQLMDTARLLPALKEELASATGLKAKLGMKVLSRIGNDEAMYILSMQLESKDRRKVVDAAIAIVSADPQNICGYHESIYEKVTDRLALIKIESARAASGNGTHSSN